MGQCSSSEPPARPLGQDRKYMQAQDLETWSLAQPGHMTGHPPDVPSRSE